MIPWNGLNLQSLWKLWKAALPPVVLVVMMVMRDEETVSSVE